MKLKHLPFYVLMLLLCACPSAEEAWHDLGSYRLINTNNLAIVNYNRYYDYCGYTRRAIFSQDSQSYLFHDGQNTYIKNLNGYSQYICSALDINAISPDLTKKFYFTSSGMIISDLQSNNGVVINPDNSHYKFDPSFSFDSNFITYCSRLKNNSSDFKIHKVNLSDNNTESFSFNVSVCNPYFLTNNKIAYYQNRKDSVVSYNLLLLDTQNSEITPIDTLLLQTSKPIYNLKNNCFFYQKNRSQIIKYDLNTNQKSIILNGLDLSVDYFFVDSEMKRIYYLMRDCLFLYDLDLSVTYKFPSKNPCYFFTLSPDGNWLLSYHFVDYDHRKNAKGLKI